MKNKAILMLFSVCLLVLSAACGQGGSNPNSGSPNASGGAGKEEFKIIYAHSTADSSNTHKTGLKFKEEMEKRSEGRVKVDVFAQYAGDREVLEAMQRGNVGMTVTSTAPVVLFDPKIAVFDLPFLFPTKETPEESMANVFKVLDTPQVQQLLASLENQGLKGLAFMGLGFRELTSNKPVAKFEDLSGLKIRTQENKYHLAAWKALGANPTPIAFNELFTALEQKTVDAQENPYEIISTSKFYEVQKYLTQTDHIFNTTLFAISKKVYDKLPEDLRPAFEEAVQATVEYSRKAAIDDASKNLANIEAGGTEIISLSVEEKEKFKAATESVWTTIKKDVGEDIVNGIVEAVQKAQ